MNVVMGKAARLVRKKKSDNWKLLNAQISKTSKPASCACDALEVDPGVYWLAPSRHWLSLTVCAPRNSSSINIEPYIHVWDERPGEGRCEVGVGRVQPRPHQPLLEDQTWTEKSLEGDEDEGLNSRPTRPSLSKLVVRFFVPFSFTDTNLHHAIISL